MDLKKIFIVDDDFIFRTATRVLLTRELGPVQITEFENGLEAYEGLMGLKGNLEKLPDIMLLDINMPVMNGWELLEDLRIGPIEIREKVHIHILTSSIAPEDLNLSRTYEFINGYITKPLTKEDIQEINRKLIHARSF